MTCVLAAHVFIFTQIEYCNGVFSDSERCEASRRQINKDDHISPVRGLVRSDFLSIDFRILLLVYKALNGSGLNYISF